MIVEVRLYKFLIVY